MNNTQSESPSDEVSKKEDDYFVQWHGHDVAKLSFNGVNWSFNYASGWLLELSGGHVERPGQLPAFVLNLMPEAKEGRAQQATSLEEILQESERFLSSIIISKNNANQSSQPQDRLEGRLSTFSDNSVFDGQCSELPLVNSGMLERMDNLADSYSVPRMSGCQAKLPCNLSEEGVLSPAGGKSFSHILKFPGFVNDPRNVRGAVEWCSMTLAQGGGVATCDFSLVALPGSDVLAYVAERFDIPVDDQDSRLIFCEDFCAAMGNTPSGKFWYSMEDMIDTLQRLSSEPEEDGVAFLKLIYANKLLENGDFHLKNAAILREASPDLKSFTSTRLAPAYDIMNTKYFNPKPSAVHTAEAMALDFDGSQHNYSLKHMVLMGKRLGLGREQAMEAMFDVASGIATKANEMRSTTFDIFETDKFKEAKNYVDNLCMRAEFFCKKDFPEIEINLDDKPRYPRP